MAKSYADTYIFRQYSEYNKKIFKFIMDCERVNTKAIDFQDVLYDIKRRKISDKLAKVITSDNVVIGIGKEALPKAFKTFVSEDPKDSKKLKLFIDCTGIIKYENGVYTCKSIDYLVSYLVSGITAYIYKLKEHTLTGNSSVIRDGAECFMRMFSYVIDIMYNITSVQQVKHRLDYISSIYFQAHIIGRDIDKSFQNISAVAAKMSGASRQDVQYINMLIEPSDFDNLNTFLIAVSRIFKFKDLNCGTFMNVWMRKFDTSAIFAPEYLPAFSTMLTNVYIGGYVNSQQLLIEKICANPLTEFAKTIIQIGDSVS